MSTPFDPEARRRLDLRFDPEAMDRLKDELDALQRERLAEALAEYEYVPPAEVAAMDRTPKDSGRLRDSTPLIRRLRPRGIFDK